jgi:glyoxylase-like metal-dependent hydrolase (beta-lactamase superfamily II)
MEGFDVRSVVILGPARTVVFDTLAHPMDMAPVRRLVGDRPVTVVYSHADWDHAWGTCGLAGWDEVVAHAAAAERFRGDVIRDLDTRREGDPETWNAVELVPPDRTVTRPLTLELGGLTLILSSLRGHTDDSLVGFIPRWGVMLAGDAVETPLPVVNEGAALPGWIRALEAWSGEPQVTTVVPAHGPVAGSELLLDTARYLRSLLVPDPPEPPADLPPFYRDTHLRNIEAARLANDPPLPHVGNPSPRTRAGDSL